MFPHITSQSGRKTGYSITPEDYSMMYKLKKPLLKLILKNAK